ncbi:hypothetical protein AOLI_G00200520 [Acnodon oligacanthus]
MPCGLGWGGDGGAVMSPPSAQAGQAEALTAPPAEHQSLQGNPHIYTPLPEASIQDNDSHSFPYFQPQKLHPRIHTV